MPLRPIFVTIGLEGSITLFASRKKIVLDSQTEIAVTNAAMELLVTCAHLAAVKDLGLTVDVVIPQLYYQIFSDDDPNTKPFLSSENAPGRYKWMSY